MADKLYLLDGTALLYRAHFAFIKNPLINSKGKNISALFGVINSFLHIIENTQAAYVAISFDRKTPTFRHNLYPAYKAQRPPMPDELAAQIEPVKQFFELIGLKEIGLDGYEADDILGTLAKQYEDEMQIVLVTSDKDYCQLVDEQSVMLDPMKDALLDRNAVYAKYGVYPEQFIDYLALVGDPSDNIPGVKSIGPKTASMLLTEHKTLDNIYANLETLKPRLQELLLENKDSAYLSKQLATIKTDVPIPKPTLDYLTFWTKDLTKAIPLLEEYEINSIKRKIELKYAEAKSPVQLPEFQDDIFSANTESPQDTSETEAKMPFEAVLVNPRNFVTLLKELKEAKQISIDTETDSPEPMLANLVGISFCVEEKKAYYLPLKHRARENLPLPEVIRHLKDALKDKVLLGHNLKFDLIVLARHGLELHNPLFDTMLAAYILDPGTLNYSLTACALNELNYKMIPISDLIGKGKNQGTFDLVEPNVACVYSAEDAWAVYKLFPIYRRKVDFSPMATLFDSIELPLIKVLQQMEMNGVAIDCSILEEISRQINQELKDLTDKIYAFAGYEFNLNSTQQLAKMLFEEKKLPLGRKTKTGFSTDNNVLEDLAVDYEITRIIIQYRQLTKLQSTYISALPKMINPQTKRIHSSFNQTVTSTGRLSSSNPNLQNIPVRTDLGREIRKAFCAKDNEHLILDADYSQIELRLLALMSEDEVLIQAFKQDLDIHKRMAAKIFNVTLEQVSTSQRRAAKTINFGILYGMGQRKLAHDLGISLSEAKKIIDDYYAQFPSIREFINQCIYKARQQHYAETLFGRRLYLPNIESKNQGLKSEAERIAVNMPIQGTAADLIKIAMIDIYNQIAEREDIKMILQVHDELIFEIQQNVREEANLIVKKCMEQALPAKYAEKVHLKTDVGIGKNWFETH
ncbi:MAG: DNA polymerase I [Candidatus Cloacimonas sp.]